MKKLKWATATVVQVDMTGKVSLTLPIVCCSFNDVAHGPAKVEDQWLSILPNQSWLKKKRGRHITFFLFRLYTFQDRDFSLIVYRL